MVNRLNAANWFVELWASFLETNMSIACIFTFTFNRLKYKFLKEISSYEKHFLTYFKTIIII